MAGGASKTGSDLARRYLRVALDFVSNYAVLIFWSLWSIATAYGLFNFGAQFKFNNAVGILALWHFLLKYYNWALLCFGVTTAAGVLLYILKNSLAARMSLVFILTIAAYIAFFGIYILFARHIFLWSLNFSLINEFLLYPLYGLGVFIGVAITTISVWNSCDAVSDHGPSISPGTIGYIALAALGALLFNFGAPLIDKYLDRWENPGLMGAVYALVIVVLLISFLFLSRHTRTDFRPPAGLGLFASTVIYLLRCFASIVDRILAAQIGYLIARPRHFLVRLAIIVGTFLVPSGIALWGANGLAVPYTHVKISAENILFWSMVIPGATTLGIYRRAAWLDDVRQRSLMTAHGIARNSMSFDNDLRAELMLCAYLLFFFALPVTLFVLNGVWNLFEINGDANPTLPEIFGWVGNELIKDVSLIKGLGEAVNHHNQTIFKANVGKPPVDFFVRLLAEITVLAAIIQTLNRTSSDGRQREQFENRDDPIDRLDMVAERDLFREAAKDWLKVECLPHYDPERLKSVVSRAGPYLSEGELLEVVGAARIAGYQIAGEAIASLVNLSLLRPRDSTKDINRIYNRLDGDLQNVRRALGGGSGGLRENDPRKRCAAEALSGLEKKFARLADLAPKADAVRMALKELGSESFSYSENDFESEIKELSRKSSILMTLEYLDETDEDDWWGQYRLSQKLEQLVTPEDADICRALATGQSPRRIRNGIALLGALGPNEASELLLLGVFQRDARVPYYLWDSLAKIGGRETIEAVRSSSDFKPENKGSWYSFESATRTIVSVAARNPEQSCAVTQLLQSCLSYEWHAQKRLAALKGLYFLYDESLDHDLIECALAGFSGPNLRTNQQARSERHLITKSRIMAVFILAKSGNKALVRAALQKILAVIEANQKDLTWGDRWVRLFEFIALRIRNETANFEGHDGKLTEDVKIKNEIQRTLRALGPENGNSSGQAESDGNTDILARFLVRQFRDQRHESEPLT